MDASGQVFLILVAELYICLMRNASTNTEFPLLELVGGGGQRGVLYSDFTVLTEKQVARLTARNSAMASATHTQLSKEIQWGRQQGVISRPYSEKSLASCRHTYWVSDPTNP